MATQPEVTYTLSSATALFKVKYGEICDNVYNSYTPLLSRIKRDTSFTGKQLELPIPLGFSGGVGSGSTLPIANVGTYSTATITRKKNYARILLDREAIFAGADNEGSFVRSTKEHVKKGVESFMRNLSRQLFAIENGMLGKGDGATTVTGAGTVASPYAVVMDATTWCEGFWEEGDFVNVGSETTDLCISLVVPATKTVSFVSATTNGGSATLASAAGSTSTSAKIYMQHSKDTDIISLYTVCTATSGTTVYGVDSSLRRWQGYLNTTSQPVTTDLVNTMITGVEKQSGKSPKLVVTSYKQLMKLKNLVESQKRYPIMGRNGNLKGQLLFEGMEVVTATGTIGVVADRMCPDGHMYFLNDDYLTIYSAGAPQWVDEDGSVFFRVSGADSFESRYHAYLQSFFVPSFQGLATALT